MVQEAPPLPLSEMAIKVLNNLPRFCPPIIGPNASVEALTCSKQRLLCQRCAVLVRMDACFSRFDDKTPTLCVCLFAVDNPRAQGNDDTTARRNYLTAGTTERESRSWSSTTANRLRSRQPSLPCSHLSKYFFLSCFHT